MKTKSDRLFAGLFECRLIITYRNLQIMILAVLPALLVTVATLYILVGQYDTLTANGTARSLYNPYLYIVYSILNVGNYLLPVIFILIPAGSAIAEKQGGMLLRTIPCRKWIMTVSEVLSLTMITAISICIAFLAFLVSVRIASCCLPLLDLSAYPIHYDIALFFLRLLAVALLIVLTQFRLHRLSCSCIIPVAFGLVMMSGIVPDDFNIYSGGVRWAWRCLNNGIPLSDTLPFLKLCTIYSCFIVISAILKQWKKLIINYRK